MKDRNASIPILEELVHLAIAVDYAKEFPHINEYEEKKRTFYDLLRKIPVEDRPFKID